MKKFCTLLLLLALVACRKAPDYAEEDDAAIQAYLLRLGLTTYEKDEETGIYWLFFRHTNSIMPQPDSEVEVSYQARTLADENVFTTDTNTVRIRLPEAMVGWRLGMVRVPVGSRLLLFVPSRFAYGSEGLAGYVAPNTPLVFHIDLIDIHPFF